MQNYSFSAVWSVEDEKYVATSAEFPGLSGLGHTAADAVAELSAAIEVAIEALVEDGEPMPEPRVVQEYSGQLRLRLPRSLHAAAAARAEEEQVSLNGLLQTYIAQGLGADRARTHVSQEVVNALALLTHHVAEVVQPQHRPASPEGPRQHVRYGAPCYPGRGGARAGARGTIPAQTTGRRDLYDRSPGQRTRLRFEPESSAPVYEERALK